MNKRYQVFISSTYEDLKEERAKVIQALWELDCIPYGMEVFPATSGTSWEWIEKAIRESDYYILIIGGKYGSIDKETGISYTQKEYEYAESINIPIIRFIVKDEQELPAKKIEQNSKIKGKLDEFKKNVMQKQSRFFTSSNDLMAQVSTSLQHLIKNNPREGWIRASSYKHYEVKKDIKPPSSKLRELPDGEEKRVIEYSYNEYDDNSKWIGKTYSITLTWNRIFYLIASYLFDNQNGFRQDYEENLLSYIKETTKIDKWISLDTDIDELMLFLMARNCTTQNTYGKWNLTITGKKYYARLKEIYKNT